MRRALIVSVLGLAGAAGPFLGAAPPGPAPARITYVANEGFLVSAGESAVLVDALFGVEPLSFAEVPGAEILERIEAGAPPFDNVRVALVTHRHVDHFDPGVAAAFLRSRPEAALVGPPQVIERLAETSGFEVLASRAHAVPATPGSDTPLTFGEVSVRALGIPHSHYMVQDESTGEMINRHRHTENLGYVVTVGGFTFFHNGDANLTVAEEYCRFDLDSPDLDAAFLGSVFWGPVEKRLATVRKCLAPRHVVLMHLNSDEKAAIAERVDALGDPSPTLVVPGERMSEIILP